MATQKPLNVYSKLLNARQQFLGAGAKKSGKNMHLRYQYFELDDIVPIAQPIFLDIGLLPVVSFEDTTASMTIIDTDNPSDRIVFTTPMRELTGNAAINPLQALGAAQTYIRRYLYMTALDIVEPDFTEATMVKPTEMPDVPEVKPVVKDEPKPVPVPEAKPVEVKAAEPAAPAKPKIPLTQAQRDDVKDKLTDVNGAPDAQQIQALKNALKAYIAKEPNRKKATEYVQKISVETVGFTKLTKVRWEELMGEIKELLK